MTTGSPTSERTEARGELVLRGRRFAWGARTYVMAILNLTPDSFSGDGLAGNLAAAIDAGARAAAAGADILDVGGESSRPGAAPVPQDEELARVVPVIEALRARLDVPISIDTYKAAVAETALAAGADLVNDIWALSADPDMGRVVAASGAPVVLMHNRSDPARVGAAGTLGTHYVDMSYADVVADVVALLGERVVAARAAGIADDHIIVDPGIGFGKTPAQSTELIDRLDEVARLGYPVLAGPSRKSFIGLALDLPPGERVEGTAAAVAIAVARGADIVRVHDVAQMVRVARMADAITRRPGRGSPDRPPPPGRRGAGPVR